ncbi:MAG: sensor histidine kinase [Desulforhopalus sp.]
MFLKISREDFSRSRLKKAVPIFLLLWSGGLLLGLVHLADVRHHLHSMERLQTEKLLDLYLALNRSSSTFYNADTLPQNRILQGLAFVRIMHGQDQILAVGDQLGSMNFRGLMALEPASDGVWLEIGKGSEKRVLTVVTRRYDNGVTVQAGKDGAREYALYLKLVRRTLYILVGSMLLLWPLALYAVKLSLRPLVTTRRMISTLLQGNGAELLPTEGSGPELDSLHVQINKLIEQNRHLVLGMQQSLDNVAHDLRTPMTRLRSVAEYGLQADNDVGRLREALSDCLEESERLLAMLRVMMSVAEAESGTMSLNLQRCDLVPSLTQAVNLYEYVAEEKNIALTLEVENSVVVRVDQTRISQVWANLIDNAIKYGRDGGWVKVSAESGGPEAIVVFEDNGMGISKNEQQKIWERLYRGDRSRSQQGLGLGLNYVQAVIAAHGGSVQVTSTLHQGARFEVHLPVG